MLEVNRLAGFGRRRDGGSALTLIRALGLTGGLKLCLDAGDAASYAGSGQPWLDLSGNGHDFNRGATSGSEASDPAFNGSSGRLSADEYWSFDAGDWFTYDSANETWMQNIHKDNAAFTIVAWLRFGALGGTAHIAGTLVNNVTSNTGFLWRKRNTDTPQLVIQGNVGAAVLDIDGTSLAIASTAAWYMLAVSLNEAVGSGGAFLFRNGAVQTFTATYASPSAGAPTATMQIAASGNGQNPLPNGSRMAVFAMWEGRALTQGEVMALFQATRGRFGA